MFGVSLFFFGLYQLVLVSRGRTTNEDVRGKYRKYKGNPFDKGFKRNCQYFWRTKSSKVVDVKTIAQDDEFEIHERAREADPVDMMEQ